MTLFAVILVLSSAVIHASWNYFAKRVRGGAAFIWLASVVTAVSYAPLAAIVIVREQPALTAAQIGVMAVSALLHVGYFILLTRGYRTGDLSLVYPLARGTGPMLSTVIAIVVLHEQPTTVALAGAALIGTGVFILTGDPRKLRQNGAGRSVAYALATGLVIAAYTVWDKQGVSVLLIPPLLFDWVSNLFRVLILTPHAVRHREQISTHWREHRRETLVVGLLSPLSYILVLTALAFSPVSYVAPMREISILIGAGLGARLLAEGDVRRRLAAASVMMVGVAALALG